MEYLLFWDSLPGEVKVVVFMIGVAVGYILLSD